MCKTFNDVPLSLTCPSRINLTQTNTFTIKSVKGVFYSFDSLIACRCNYCFQTIYNSTCWQLNYTAVTLSRLFKKQTERNVKGLGIDKVICTCHQRTVHHGTLCIGLFVVISNVVALLSAALMISYPLYTALLSCSRWIGNPINHSSTTVSVSPSCLSAHCFNHMRFSESN